MSKEIPVNTGKQTCWTQNYDGSPRGPNDIGNQYTSHRLFHSLEIPHPRIPTPKKDSKKWLDAGRKDLLDNYEKQENSESGIDLWN
jgi:hypothetical protein